MTDTDDRIRKRAYEIWERDGRPDGREKEHWSKAATEIEAEEDKAVGASATADAGKGSDSVGDAGKEKHGRTKAAASTRSAEKSENVPPANRRNGGKMAAPPSGISSGLQPSGTSPGGGPGASQGSLGTGGGSSEASGNVKKSPRSGRAS